MTGPKQPEGATPQSETWRIQKLGHYWSLVTGGSVGVRIAGGMTKRDAERASHAVNHHQQMVEALRHLVFECSEVGSPANGTLERARAVLSDLEGKP